MIWDESFFSKFNFHPVVKLPKDYKVYDFTDPENTPEPAAYSVGRYNEKRPGLYSTEQFTSESRNIHMGVDLGAPVDTPVFSFFKGEIFKLGNNKATGDYGPTVITKHSFDGHTLYALYGHLSLCSIEGKKVGEVVEKGASIGKLGDMSVNGGWPPHVHFQLSTQEPAETDIPGVVSSLDHALSLQIYPNPLWVLGPLY